MIRVERAPEPATFEVRVRQRGLSAIAELVGERPTITRAGPRRAKIANSREELRAEDFPPFWTEALPDLWEAYHRVCAFCCLYIERVTGARSVDHMVPKSVSWDRVYEWSNYRLACALMNTRKHVVQSALDPFEIEDGWFELELVEYRVTVREGLEPKVDASVKAAIRDLRLNERDCCEARAEYGECYLNGDISLGHLQRRAPFVARELRRQGRLRPEET